MHNSTRLVLGSASPRRTELLTQINIAHDVVPAAIDEDSVIGSGSPATTIQAISNAKAAALRLRFANSWVLCADTGVVVDQVILGKPKSMTDAQMMLTRLSGCEHSVFTAFTLQRGDQVHSECVETKVHFRPLKNEEILEYLATGEANDKAGSYGIQGAAGSFVERIDGCYFNVVGLPLSRVFSALQRIAPEVL